MNRYVVFYIESSLGKHIVAIAVTKYIKNNYENRELIVVCVYPKVSLNLSYVSRVCKIGFTSYFYQDFILNKDTLLFKHEPYFTTFHTHKQQSLISN